MGKRALLLLTTGVGILMLGEGVLALVGFRYEIKPERVEFGWPDPASRSALYEADPDLFWVTTDYRETLQAIRSREPRRRRLGSYSPFLGDRKPENAGRRGELL